MTCSTEDVNEVSKVDLKNFQISLNIALENFHVLGQ